MKSIHELFKLTLKYLNEHELISGLCLLFVHMKQRDIITKGEHDMLFLYLIHNRPRGKEPSEHYWKICIKKWRRVWLSKHIKLTAPSIGRIDNDVFPIK